MGPDRHYAGVALGHPVDVATVHIRRTPVTNVRFRRFVEASDHVTVVEIPPDPEIPVRVRSFGRSLAEKRGRNDRRVRP
jgi:formylglycine-generating enzyme required for sulfatase activity